MRNIVLALLALLLPACTSMSSGMYGQGGGGGSSEAPAPVGASMSPAVGQVCTYTEQQGCIELDVLIVEYDPAVPELQSLVDGRAESADVAVKVYQLVKAGRIRLYGGCMPLRSYFWQVNTSVRHEQMASYVATPGAAPGAVLQRGWIQAVAPGSVQVPVAPADSGLGPVSAVFDHAGCGGKAAWQFPWQYITNRTYTLICPQPQRGERILYPRRNQDVTAGLHLRSGKFWGRAQREGWEYGLFVIVVEPSRPTS